MGRFSSLRENAVISHPLQRASGLAPTGEEFPADPAFVAAFGDQPEDVRVFEFARARLVAVRRIRDLDVLDQVEIFKKTAGNVALVYLDVVEIEDGAEVVRANPLHHLAHVIEAAKEVTGIVAKVVRLDKEDDT